MTPPDPGVDADAGQGTGGPQAPAATTNPLGQATARLHYAARLEDAIDRRVARVLRTRAWTVRVEPYPGYGTPDWIRVMGRTVLAAPHVPDEELPGAGAAQAGDWHGSPAHAVRGWRSFLTASVAGAHVDVTVGDQVHRLVADRGGYLDHVLAAHLPPGWHDVTLRTQDGVTTTAPIQVVDPAVRCGIVADIDDTVMVTRLPRMLVAGWNSFIRHEQAREPVPGMAGLFSRLLSDEPRAPVVYLSTGPWNSAPAIGRFLRRHRFPAGTLLLTDWGPTNTGWFRSGPRHKVTQLHRLFTEFPDIRWVLVGDDGQHDPEIYAGAAKHFPDRVRAILLRQLTFAEHVLASGALTSSPEGAQAEQAARAEHVPVLLGPDGRSLVAQLDEAGLRL
jgi:phosphatidate phosphatase APP1